MTNDLLTMGKSDSHHSHFTVNGAESFITLPSLSLITTGNFTRHNQDLILEDQDGKTFVVENYFALEPRPILKLADSAASLSPDLVNSFLTKVDFSGEGSVTLADKTTPVIGNVSSFVGEAYILRGGQRIEVIAGIQVHQGDIIQTGKQSAIKIHFVDETLFSLADNAKLALDKMVFDPLTQAGESKFSMLQGGFLFVSGKIAKTDPNDMVVTTPVATIGIRGTIVAGKIEQDGNFNFSVVDGAVAVSVPGQLNPIVVDQPFTTIQGLVGANGSITTSTSLSSVNEVIGRNAAQFSALNVQDIKAIEAAVKASASDNGQTIDLDLNNVVKNAIEQSQSDLEANNAETEATATTSPSANSDNESTTTTQGNTATSATSTTVASSTTSTAVSTSSSVDNVPPNLNFTSATSTEEKHTYTLSGTSEAGAKIAITYNGTILNLITDSGGKWSQTYVLNDIGTASFSVTATDAMGNKSAAKILNVNVVADTIDPVVTITSDTSNFVENVEATLSGTGEPESTIVIKQNGEEIGTATVSLDGKWSTTVIPNAATSESDDADHIPDSDFSFEVTDVAGNTTTQSTTYNVKETDAPSITLADATEDYNQTYIERGTDYIVSGTTEAYSTLTLTINGSNQTTTADENGAWSYTIPTSGDEDAKTYDISIVATDPSGNISDATSLSLMVDDTIAPLLGDLVESQNTNDVIFESQTTTYQIEGDAEAGSIITMIVTDASGINDHIYTTEATASETSDYGGIWTISVDLTYIAQNARVNFEVYTTDEAGNESIHQIFYLNQVDNIPPVITISTDNLDHIEFGEDYILSGTTEAGSVVTVTVNDGTNDTTFEATADETGAWAATLATSSLASGASISYTVTAIDANGNATAAATAPVTLSVSDEVPPVVTFTSANQVEFGQDYTLTGNTEPGSEVYITVNGDTNTVITVQADATTGDWSYGITTNADANNTSYNFSVSAKDTANNDSTSNATLTVKVVDTAPPELTLETPVTNLSQLMLEDSGDSTTLTGKVEAGSSVTVLVNGVSLETSVGTTVVDGKVDWSVTIPPQDAGTATITISATDANGVETADGNGTLSFDTVPVNTTLTLDTLPSATDPDGSLTLTGTATLAGAMVKVNIGGTDYSATVNDAADTWSLTLSASQLAAIDTDANTAGIQFTIQNIAVSNTTGYSKTIDESNNSQSINILSYSVVTETIVENQSFVLNGIATAGNQISVSFRGFTQNVTVAGDGTWSATISVSASNNDTTLTVTEKPPNDDTAIAISSISITNIIEAAENTDYSLATDGVILGDLNASNINLTGYNDIFYAHLDGTSVNAGAGDDNINAEVTMFSNTSTNFDGGDGTDTLTLYSAGLTNDVSITASKITNMETLNIMDVADVGSILSNTSYGTMTIAQDSGTIFSDTITVGIDTTGTANHYILTTSSVDWDSVSLSNGMDASLILTNDSTLGNVTVDESSLSITGDNLNLSNLSLTDGSVLNLSGNIDLTVTSSGAIDIDASSSISLNAGHDLNSLSNALDFSQASSLNLDGELVIYGDGQSFGNSTTNTTIVDFAAQNSSETFASNETFGSIIFLDESGNNLAQTLVTNGATTLLMPIYENGDFQLSLQDITNNTSASQTYSSNLYIVNTGIGDQSIAFDADNQSGVFGRDNANDSVTLTGTTSQPTLIGYFDGGAGGNDELVIDGQAIYFSSSYDASTKVMDYQINRIETLDITGATYGDGTDASLTLTADMVKAFTEAVNQEVTSLFSGVDGKDSLIVKESSAGNQFDTTGWTQGNDITSNDNHSYSVYTQDGATIYLLKE